MVKATMEFLSKKRLVFVIPAEDLAKDAFWTFAVGRSLMGGGPIGLTLTDKRTRVDVYCVGVGLRKGEGARELLAAGIIGVLVAG